MVQLSVLSAENESLRGTPGLGWPSRYLTADYLCSATFLATSTAVRLLQQKSMRHNPSALFCVSMTLF